MIKKNHLSHSLRHHFSHHSGHPVNNTLNHQWVVSEPSFTSTTMYVYFYLSATRTPEPWLRRPAAFCWGLNKLRKALPLLERSWHLTQISKPQAPSGKENLLGREKNLAHRKWNVVNARVIQHQKNRHTHPSWKGSPKGRPRWGDQNLNADARSRSEKLQPHVLVTPSLASLATITGCRSRTTRTSNGQNWQGRQVLALITLMCIPLRIRGL